MKKRNVVILSLLLIYTITVPVFAYIYFSKTEPTYVTAGIVVNTPTLDIGFYWDGECTQPVTSFDFGNIAHPAQPTYLWKQIYIRNEGDVWLAITWNSTLSSLTSEISERWNYPGADWFGNPIPAWDGVSIINGTTIQPGQVKLTYYFICVHAYAAFRTYNWTLTAWGEYYY